MPQSREETLEHLKKANDVRTGRAVEIRRISTERPAPSHRLAADAIRNPPDVLRTMAVIGFLRRAPRGLGSATAVRLLRRYNIPERATLGELDAAERDRLAAAVRENAKRFA